MRGHYTRLLLIGLTLSLTGWASKSFADPGSGKYTQNWANFNTQLIIKAKSFQNAPRLLDGYGDFEYIEYASAGMTLGALINAGSTDLKSPKPGVVYLHGGFGLSTGELAAAQMFVDAGFVVLAPTWRGENENPGYFECFFGEVADAKAAIRWLAGQQNVNADEIYVFGWSVGGGIALNLALHDDIPVRISGSSAGIYDLDLITAWATEDDYIKFPYDHQNDLENYYRLPIYHLQDMIRPHYTYVGMNDGYEQIQKLYSELYPKEKTELHLQGTEGDHVSSLPVAINEFLKVISGEENSPGH